MADEAWRERMLRSKEIYGSRASADPHAGHQLDGETGLCSCGVVRDDGTAADAADDAATE